MQTFNIYQEAKRFWAFAVELRDAKLAGAATTIDELRDELDAMARYSEFPAIRRACESVLGV